MHFEAFGKRTIIVNSLDDAVELLERRANNYSDRPYIPMVNLTGWTFTTAFKSYGSDDWHKHRRLMQQSFKPSTALTYRAKQTEKTYEMLHRLLQSPEDFMTHIRALTAGIVMSTVYGYDITSMNDRFVDLAEQSLVALSQSTFPGAAAVNMFPHLRFLPSWFPGTECKKFGASALQLITEIGLQAAGTASPSLVSTLLDKFKSEEDHRILQEVAATGYAAGADTSSSVLGSFFYIMTIYPDIQQKAQRAIDDSVGKDRLPTYDDQSSLPYIQALYRECLRMKPVLPLCVFHSATADDVYKGYYIPKGTTVMPNVWAMTRDPIIYKDPEQFNPDR